MSRIVIATAGGFLAFLSFGFVDNLKGALLPQILASESLNYRQGGTILLASYLGFVIATLLCGVIADFVGNIGVLSLAGACIALGCVCMGLSNSYWMLILLMWLIGAGLGAIEVGGNALMVELHSDSRGLYLNLLSTFHGIGSLVVPVYASWTISLQFTWQASYGLSSLILVPMLLCFIPTLLGRRLFKIKPFSSTEPQASWNWREVKQYAFSSPMFAYYLLISTYVATEISVASWLVEFLQAEHGMSVQQSSVGLSCFFGLIMLGRAVGGFLVGRIGYMQAITVSLVASLACLLAGILGSGWLVWFLPVSGLFMSIAFPTIVASASCLHQSHLGTILGILFTFGGLGGALGPWLVGYVSDFADLRVGLGCTWIYSLVAIGSLMTIRLGEKPD